MGARLSATVNPVVADPTNWHYAATPLIAAELGRLRLWTVPKPCVRITRPARAHDGTAGAVTLFLLVATTPATRPAVQTSITLAA